MCGIAGYCFKKTDKPNVDQLRRLLEPIQKRGPDDEGISLISRRDGTHRFYKTLRTVASIASKLPNISESSSLISCDIALLHSRYAIIDLSDAGHQPFQSADGSIVAVFNGEIYNYIELKEELLAQGVKFRTNSDTEVLVEGFRAWGNELWAKMNGFWAIVLYDFNRQCLIFSRDRLGVAPLYYKETTDGIYFASFIKPLLDLDPSRTKINEESLRGFIQTGFKDINDATFYTDIKSVPQASVVELSLDQHLFKQARITKYWDFPSRIYTPNDISFSDAVKKFRSLLFASVELRLRSDVKVAFELSGGLDSSSIVAVAAHLRPNRITTYTAKIKNADEEPVARSILKKYSLDYHVITEIEADFVNECDSFSQLMEEPYDNPNDYTHYMMLKQMKKEGVDVVITGAGGDEVLAGYESAFWPKAYAQWRKDGVQAYAQADWHEFCRRFRNKKNIATTLKHYAQLPCKLFEKKKKNRSVSGYTKMTEALQYQEKYEAMDFSQQRRFHFETALLPYYMRSSDHFTMSIPIEHRFPLLDYRIVEFGLQLPIPYLFHNGWTKYILRKAMEPYLPHEIVWRRHKMGFAFPYRSYFQTQQNAFKSTFDKLPQKSLGLNREESYEALLKNDPLKLWRLLSIGIWLKRL